MILDWFTNRGLICEESTKPGNKIFLYEIYVAIADMVKIMLYI